MNIRKFFSCVCVLLCTLFSVLTAKEVQVESKLTADKTLDSAIDLHLTGDAPLAANVKVNLTHTDAWLFFDNVRPRYSIHIKHLFSSTGSRSNRKRTDVSVFISRAR